jgi:hypothetical protein
VHIQVPNIIFVNKNTYRILRGKKLKKRGQFEDIFLDGKIILREIFKEYDEKDCTRLIWLRFKKLCGVCKRYN